MKLRYVSFLQSYFHIYLLILKIRSQSVDCQSTINNDDEAAEGNDS